MTEIEMEKLLKPESPACLIIKAKFKPIGGTDRFQPAGFPEIGHVLYDAPRGMNSTEKVCIVDSPASMANHLEAACMAGPEDFELHRDLKGLPYILCVTDRNMKQENGIIIQDPNDPHDKVVLTSITEGHRIASDYFLDSVVNPRWEPERKAEKKGTKKIETIPAQWTGQTFREKLREEFGITEIQKNKTYFIHPEDWWSIYNTIFKYDPNSLVHGVLLAKEQIKISRFLTAHLEAFGAARVGRSGMKYDPLGKTASGQPIFAVDEETANEIRGTFILDLALLRSYGREDKGLNMVQKRLLLDLALWKVTRLITYPFRYRTQCHLMAYDIEMSTEKTAIGKSLPDLDIVRSIHECKFDSTPMTKVYYSASKLFKVGEEKEESTEEEEKTEEKPVD